MIQITDLSKLETIRDNMLGLVYSQNDNWNDQVYSRIINVHITPAISECDSTISQVSSSIRQVVSIFQQMQRIASCH